MKRSIMELLVAVADLGFSKRRFLVLKQKRIQLRLGQAKLID